MDGRHPGTRWQEPERHQEGREDGFRDRAHVDDKFAERSKAPDVTGPGTFVIPLQRRTLAGEPDLPLSAPRGVC
jgi:hypothetical protein